MEKRQDLRPCLVLVLCSLVTFVNSLTCESCQLTSCPVISDCKAGLVMDVCNCCAICGQAVGERCGGRFGLSGKCGIELYCDRTLDATGNLLAVSPTAVGTCKGKVITHN